MNRIQITDEWLYRYMPMAAEAFLEDIEKEIDYKYEFSIGFEKKMKRLQRWERRRSIRSAVYKIGRRYLHIAAVVVVIVFLCSMSIEACRIVFFDTIKTIWEDSFLYPESVKLIVFICQSTIRLAKSRKCTLIMLNKPVLM